MGRLSRSMREQIATLTPTLSLSEGDRGRGGTVPLPLPRRGGEGRVRGRSAQAGEVLRHEIRPDVVGIGGGEALCLWLLRRGNVRVRVLCHVPPDPPTTPTRRAPRYTPLMPTTLQRQLLFASCWV